LTTSIPFEFALDLYVPGIILSAMLLIQLGLHYLSRVKRRLNFCILITGLSASFLSVLNYFTNSGITGPTLIFSIGTFFLLIAVSPPKNSIWWLILYLLTGTVLSVYEFYNPSSIQNSYTKRFDYFLDITNTYHTVLVMIFWCAHALVKNYRDEKKSSDLKAIELKKINSEKNRLFSIISHDLRAPLTSIQSYLQLLTNVDLALTDRKQLELKLLNHTAGTKEMLDNLLLWSKSQMEGAKVNITSVDALEVLISTIDLTVQIAANKNIVLTKNFPERLSIKADKDMLQLSVRNLLSNAVKFTHQNGTIHIAAFIENENGVIEIRDNGLGISSKDQNSIFSSNLKPTQGTNKEKGVGLGLILCKEYTDLQGGQISFRSKPGEGTSFFIKLPLSDDSGTAHMFVA
jgi:signal transduction histidine kinase